MTKVAITCERLAGVYDFTQAFKHPLADAPVHVIDVEYIKKRIGFIQEELKELLEAAESGDIVGCLDALLDIDYFNLGTVLGLGLTEKFGAGFKIVQAANMAKLCSSPEEVAETQALYENSGIATEYQEVLPGKFAVYNSETKKVMKSIAYVAPDLKQLFAA